MEFFFHNHTDQLVSILIVEVDTDLTVFYKKKFIYPDQAGKIIVYYENNDLGRFKYKI